MRYISTRGQAAPLSFVEMLLTGLAPDGGLYLPEAWPQITAGLRQAMAGQPYTAVARSVLQPLVGDSFAAEDLGADIDAAYASFVDDEIAPLRAIGDNLYLLELFHGPTLAFKDVAMQLIGRQFSRALAMRGGRATVLAATSGDTGSAAIAALGDLPHIKVFVLHPHGRVSEVQRRQMTAAPYKNVYNIAIEGNFDDAQSIVKSLFADTAFADSVDLSAVNSINFARIAAQIVYYFTAASHFTQKPTFVVPTGNFGDVFAGEAAMRMGLPVERLVVATNANAIMARTLNEGIYEAGSAKPTLSPSMDIQVASNFERALFEAAGRDPAYIREAFANFASLRTIELTPALRQNLAARYAAHACDDDRTIAAIAQVHRDTGRLIDPHTAVGVAAAKALYPAPERPVVVLSTAHAAKFPDAVKRATGQIPEPPQRLKDMLGAEERYCVMKADKDLIRQFVTEHA